MLPSAAFQDHRRKWLTGTDPGFLLEGGVPLRNGRTDILVTERKQMLIANTKKKAFAQAII